MKLVDAVRYLGIDADISMNGKWAQLQGERCTVYVVEMSRQQGFLGWCDHPAERAVERYANPLDAIRSGLERSGRQSIEGKNESTSDRSSENGAS